MTKKGLILASIIVISEVIWFFYIRHALSSEGFQGAEGHFVEFIKIVVPMSFLIHLPFPIILITQFMNKPFYKLLGFQIIGIGLMNVVNVMVSDYTAYTFISSIIFTISAITILGLAIFAFVEKNLKVAGAYCTALFISITVFGEIGVRILGYFFPRNIVIEDDPVYILLQMSVYVFYAVSAFSVILVIHESYEEEYGNE